MIRHAWQFLTVELDFVRFDCLRLIREAVVDAQRHFVSFPTVDRRRNRRRSNTRCSDGLGILPAGVRDHVVAFVADVGWVVDVTHDIDGLDAAQFFDSRLNGSPLQQARIFFFRFPPGQVDGDDSGCFGLEDPSAAGGGGFRILCTPKI